MRILAALMIGALATAGAHAAAFTNGSFETLGSPSSYPGAGTFNTFGNGSTAITGWTVTSGSVDYIDAAFWQASDGRYSLDMSGTEPGSIEQSFDTIIGAAYTVTFDLSKNYTAAGGTLRVGAAGTTQDYIFTSPNTASDMMWSTRTFAFTALGGSTTLSFAGIGGGNAGPALDNVGVSAVTGAVPEPATWAMMLGGFGLVGGALRRRQAGIATIA